VTARDRSARISALVILGGLLVGGLVLDHADDDGSPAATEVEAGVAMPAARSGPSLASTWYCAAGTSNEGGFGDPVVLIANPTDHGRSATITAVTGAIAPPPAAVAEAGGSTSSTAKATTTSSTSTTTASTAGSTGASTTAARAAAPATTIDVPARSRVAYRMADLVQAPLVGAVVEVDGGEVAVEHELTGDLGRATAPCSTTVSPSWSFAWGVTTRGNRELLVFMNPFPDDATVDIAFATDEGVRDTVRFNGFVVPGRSVVGAYVDEDVTRKEQVSAQVTVRGGRLVVDRVQTFTGVDGREGITVGLGAPVPAKVWMFPDGLTGPGLAEQIVVYNPGTRVAEAQVEVRLDDPDANEVPEPFDLTVPPGRYAIVNLHEEERIPAGVGHSVFVRSPDVPVVAERAVAATEGASRHGVSTALGAPLGAPTWILPGGGTSAERDEFVTLLNASDTDRVTFSITSPTAGQDLAIQGLQDLELEPGARTSIRIGDHSLREDLPLLIRASGPIVVERGLYRVGGDGISQAIGIPSDEGAEAPPAG
jgi:hypothetical protein